MAVPTNALYSACACLGEIPTYTETSTVSLLISRTVTATVRLPSVDKISREADNVQITPSADVTLALSTSTVTLGVLATLRTTLVVYVTETLTLSLLSVSTVSLTSTSTLQTLQISTLTTTSRTTDTLTTLDVRTSLTQSTVSSTSLVRTTRTTTSLSTQTFSTTSTSLSTSYTTSTSSTQTTTTTIFPAPITCLASLPTACTNLANFNGLSLLTQAPLCSLAISSLLSGTPSSNASNCLSTAIINIFTQGTDIVTCLNNAVLCV